LDGPHAPSKCPMRPHAAPCGPMRPHAAPCAPIHRGFPLGPQCHMSLSLHHHQPPARQVPQCLQGCSRSRGRWRRAGGGRGWTGLGRVRDWQLSALGSRLSALGSSCCWFCFCFCFSFFFRFRFRLFLFCLFCLCVPLLQVLNWGVGVGVGRVACGCGCVRVWCVVVPVV
jgi:hypothetical protein